MSYCIGVNRVGMDALNHVYPGHSAVYNVLGDKISSINENKEQIEMITLSKTHVMTHRNKLKFLNDRDLFTLK